MSQGTYDDSGWRKRDGKKKPENHSNKNAELTSKRAYVVERHSTKQAQAVVTTLNNYKAHLVKKAPDIKKKKKCVCTHTKPCSLWCARVAAPSLAQP